MLTIFITAYDRYAVRAFETNAIDYLLKPIGHARFARALVRAKEKIVERSQRDTASRIISTLAHIQRHNSYLEHLPVPKNGRILLVKAKEIDWIEANGNYARLHIGTGTHEIRETLNSGAKA